jgi:arsenate reductase-like glutaredoxin family protein
MPRKDAKKSTKFEVKKRVMKVFDLLAKGVSRADIIQFAAKSEWDVSIRTVDTYIQRAHTLFSKHSQIKIDQETGLAIHQLRNLYESNMKIHDYKTALATRKELSELLGLYQPKKTQIGNLDNQPLVIRVVNANDEND